MFKIGEKIIYDGKCEYYDELKKYETYTVSDLFDESDFDSENFLFSVSEKCTGIYYSEFFITLKEYRKIKLKLLCLKKEIK